MKSKGKIAIVTNISWNLFNFRRGLARSITEAGFEPVLMAAPDNYEKKLVDEGWTFVPVKHLERTGTNPFSDVQLFFEFVSLFKKHQISCVLNYNAKPLVYASIASSYLNIPFFPTITGLAGPFSGNRTIVRQIVKVLYRIAFRRSSRVIFQNADDRDYFVRKNIINRTKSVLVNGSGVNLDQFKSEDLAVPTNKIVFLMFSRLTKTKGVYHYVEAAKELKKTYNEVEFRLLGPFDHDKFAVKKEEVAAWNESETIDYLGVSDSIKNEISEADVIVYPSYYKEGIPKALMEAAAMSKPIITTDNVGCREVVTHGLNGFLIPVKDTSALVAACEKVILMKKEDRQKMGEASRKIAESKFNEDDVFLVYNTLIQNALHS